MFKSKAMTPTGGWNPSPPSPRCLPYPAFHSALRPNTNPTWALAVSRTPGRNPVAPIGARKAAATEQPPAEGAPVPQALHRAQRVTQSDRTIRRPAEGRDRQRPAQASGAASPGRRPGCSNHAVQRPAPLCQGQEPRAHACPSAPLVTPRRSADGSGHREKPFCRGDFKTNVSEE